MPGMRAGKGATSETSPSKTDPSSSSISKSASQPSSYGPSPDIRRKLRLLSIPALAVLVLGLLLIGWSTSFTFLGMQRYWTFDEDAVDKT